MYAMTFAGGKNTTERKMMQTETYRKEALPVSSAVELRDERQTQLLDRLGMHRVHDVSSMNQKLEMARLLYPEMTGKQLKMWRKFLPYDSTFRKYDFDVPPVEALEAINDAKDLQCFGEIQIWDPRGNTF